MTTGLANKGKEDKAAFPQLEPVSLAEGVVAALKDAFFSGVLKPGAVIVEREIARQMNVGTPAVREALICLKHEGFVRRVKNKGTFVTTFDVDEIRELYTLRVGLRISLCSGLDRGSPKRTRKQLRTLVDRLVEAGGGGEKPRVPGVTLNFTGTAGSFPEIHSWRETLERLVIRYSHLLCFASAHPLTAELGREHYALVEALRSMEEPDFSLWVRLQDWLPMDFVHGVRPIVPLPTEP